MLAACNVMAAAASTVPVSGFVFFFFFGIGVELDVPIVLGVKRRVDDEGFFIGKEDYSARISSFFKGVYEAFGPRGAGLAAS